ALTRLSLEGLILVSPAQPYVCIGYHQDVTQEVDLETCQGLGLPVFRREVGGGAVYLDGDQLFYQLVLRRDHPLAHGSKADFYARFLEPVAQTYRDLGVEASFRPVNDIVTAEGRKISGNGAAEIGQGVVLVGNLIVDFDYDTMVRVLRVPDEKFRDKIHRSLRENLTTLRRELPQVPPREVLVATLRRNLERVLGPLEDATLPEKVWDEVARLERTHTTEEWLHGMRRRAGARKVRISGDTQVIRNAHKAPGGLLRATLEVKAGRIASVDLSGDFFIYPPQAVERLQARLEGVRLGDAEEVVAAFYREEGVESPGVTPRDWAAVLQAG
ncbi:MAG: lipoate--protein ligase family protein, partial [Anaerolineae bacterium]|nr:lipoate--protein ligase family protein [Anaerolineae bacterium]